MQIIVVNRVLSWEETKDILRELNKVNGDRTELYANVELPETLKDYTHGKIGLTPEEKKQINYDVFEKMLNFGEKEIEGKKITDVLTVEKASIWHYHKFRIYFLLRNLYYEIELIEKLKKEYREVLYFTDVYALSEHNFKSTGIQIRFSGNTKERINKGAILKYILFFTLRVLFSFSMLNRIKRKEHIVIDHSLRQICLNIDTLKPEKGNSYIQYLLDRLTEEFVILDDVELPKLKGKTKFKIDVDRFCRGKNKNRFFGEYVLFRGLLAGDVRRQTKKHYREVLRHLNEMNDKIEDSFDRMVIRRMLAFSKTNQLFLFKYFSYRKFFAKHNFKTVTTIDENSPRIKSVLDAAKSNRVKTVGIQHGTIHALHPAYVFTGEDRERGIMPDYMLVWGDYWKKLLEEKGNYDPQSLVTTGQVRTDIIPVLLNSKIGIPEIEESDKKIVLYASQFQRDPELRKRAAYDIFNSVKNFPGWLLVIKLHPSELNEFGYYHAIAKETGCTNYQIHYWTDLYLLLSKSDVVTTCFSTVGTETIYFEKPLVIIDHLKQDIQNYHKNGVAFRAADENELKSTLVQILNGKLQINREAYQKFISKYAYKIDGKVSQRIIGFVKNLD
ncbi:MAG: hypothetical protein B6D64_11370 [Bacteroidetes bacterium 4484_276]|nr:MAG: hypothetical protein B6D64_11370 [Bacteroidetes bacterium 4484_276]